MTEPTAVFDALADHLRLLVHGLEDGKGGNEGYPAPGSPAALENEDHLLHGEWGQTPARDANGFGRLLCISASDHMLGLADMLQAKMTGAFVSFTVGRGAMEASGRSWYLMDPAVDLRERVRRYVNEKLWSINESQRFLEGLQSDPRQLDAVEHAIRRTAERQGFKVQKTRSGWQLDIERPSAMAVCDLVVSAQSRSSLGTANYRFLSASAHGGEAGLAGHLDLGSDGRVTVGKNPKHQALFLLLPVRAYVAMGDRFLHHFGWDTTSWNQARDTALDFWVQQATRDL